MSNPAVLEPVAEDDPCGPDLRWDADYQAVAQTFETLLAQEVSVANAEVVETSQGTFEDIVLSAESLCRKTKDIGVLAIYAEACWHDQGLAAFADAMVDIVAVAEQWAHPTTGVHPRADPEDGDLSERASPLGKLLLRIPTLAATVGWGRREPDSSIRQEAADQLQTVFNDWNERLEPAFGRQLPSKQDAWSALGSLLGSHLDRMDTFEEGDEELTRTTQASTLDPWDLIERAAQQMERQHRHSPALPILRLMATWRSRDIVEIMQSMSETGLQLEQVLQSMKQQTER